MTRVTSISERFAGERVTNLTDQHLCVQVVGHDSNLVARVARLIVTSRYEVELHSCVTRALESRIRSAGCRVFVAREMNSAGFDAATSFLEEENSAPLILVARASDFATCRSAFKRGVFDFSLIPLDPDPFNDMIERAVQRDIEQRREKSRRAEVARRQGRLTRRETQVLGHLVQGRTIKEIAMQLGFSVQTAAKHRTSVHRKMQVDGDVALVHLVASATAAINLRREDDLWHAGRDSLSSASTRRSRNRGDRGSALNSTGLSDHD